MTQGRSLQVGNRRVAEYAAKRAAESAMLHAAQPDATAVEMPDGTVIQVNAIALVEVNNFTPENRHDAYTVRVGLASGESWRSARMTAQQALDLKAQLVDAMGGRDCVPRLVLVDTNTATARTYTAEQIRAAVDSVMHDLITGQPRPAADDEESISAMVLAELDERAKAI